jgi:hypothetical protein
MDGNAEHSKTRIWVIFASVVVAVITFIVTRYFVTKYSELQAQLEAVKQASPSRAAPGPSPSVTKSSSTDKTLSQIGQLEPALVAALTGTATPHDSNSGGTRPAASPIPSQPQDLLTPSESASWPRTTSSLAPPLVSSRPSSRSPSRPKRMYRSVFHLMANLTSISYSIPSSPQYTPGLCPGCATSHPLEPVTRRRHRSPHGTLPFPTFGAGRQSPTRGRVLPAPDFDPATRSFRQSPHCVGWAPPGRRFPTHPASRDYSERPHSGREP